MHGANNPQIIGNWEEMYGNACGNALNLRQRIAL